MTEVELTEKLAAIIDEYEVVQEQWNKLSQLVGCADQERANEFRAKAATEADSALRLQMTAERHRIQIEDERRRTEAWLAHLKETVEEQKRHNHEMERIEREKQ